MSNEQKFVSAEPFLRLAQRTQATSKPKLIDLLSTVKDHPGGLPVQALAIDYATDVYTVNRMLSPYIKKNILHSERGRDGQLYVRF